MTADIVIRKAVVEEADRLADIAYEAWERGILPLLSEVPGMRHSEKRRLAIAVHEMLERIIVAEVEGNPVGWCARARSRSYIPFLFVTPEYNRSVPGVLKNAIDVGSRPYGKSIWDKKPAAVMSVSPGAIGAFGANHHLRQSLVFLNMPTMQQPEAYVGNAASLFNDDDSLTEKSKEFFSNFINSFAAWIALIKG